MKATLFIKNAVVLSLSLSVAPPPLKGASVQSGSGKAAAVSLMRTELCSSSSSSGVNCNGASLGCSQRQQFCTASGRERKIKAERREGGGGGGGGLLSRSQKLWKRLRLAGRRFSTTGCPSLVFIRQLRRRFVSAGFH